MCWISSLAATLFTLLTLPGCATQPGVDYTVRLDRARNQIVRIEATVANPGDAADFILPTWRPGRYGILDFAADVRIWDATDQSGNALPVQKIRKNAWRVDSAGAESVTFGYDIFANDLGLRTRHADDSHVFLNGSSIFVLNPPTRETPHLVRLDGMPEDWTIASGLPAGGDAHTLVAASYDVLVDSPIEIGTHRSIAFEVDGTPYEIAIWGECAKDDDELVEDFTKIIEVCIDIFDSVHFDRYVFLIHSADGIGGGTEHLNSTIMQTRPCSFESSSSYRGFLGLVTHEFFHTWNVKNFRPAGITPYDYDRENYTTSLWIAEGCTSYYDDLLLARTGQRSVRNYLDSLQGSIGSVLSNPGKNFMSVEQASYDAWLKAWGPSSPDHRNTTVSIYTHGAMVTFGLDMLIRRETAGERSFDDVMRLMNERYPLDKGGYTPEQFQATVAEVAGTDVSDFFARHIAGREEIPFAELIGVVGLSLERRSDEPEPFAGVSLRDSGGKAVVSRVIDDSPAFEAGLILNDEIVAANGKSVDTGSWNNLVSESDPGDVIRVGLFRRGEFREVDLTVAGVVPERYRIDYLDDPTDEQKANYESWTGQSWPGE
ncbi:MAG: M61 family metallopeptidase [Phycisphaerales bacterium JB058]